MYRKVAFVFLLLLMAAASTSAATIGYMVVLSGLTEEPPNGSPGTGFANIVVDDVANTLAISVTFDGLASPTSAAHIHVFNGPADSNTSDTLGPVATATPYFPGFPIGVTSGSYLMSFDMTQAASFSASFVTAAGGIDAARMALFTGLAEGRAYLNVHTNLFPSGEIRGFAVATPEPGTVGLMAFSVAGLALALRRRAVQR